jgi:hypothetical protein
MRLITSILGFLFGGDTSGSNLAGPEPGRTDGQEVEERFQYYNSFSLKDGHLLASELEKHEIPFQVEFNDGIDPAATRFGNGGNNASMTIYIEETYRDILDDFVKLHFH